MIIRSPYTGSGVVVMSWHGSRGLCVWDKPDLQQAAAGEVFCYPLR